MKELKFSFEDEKGNSITWVEDSENDRCERCVCNEGFTTEEEFLLREEMCQQKKCMFFVNEKTNEFVEIYEMPCNTPLTDYIAKFGRFE